MITLHKVHYQSNNKDIFHNVSLKINYGEMIFITGPSGAGKTTLLKLISGIDNKFDGDISVDNHHLKSLTSSELTLLQNNIGKVLSTPLLLDDLSVKENLSIPLEILGYSKEAIDKKVKKIAKIFNIEDMLLRSTEELSQGEQQLINIVRATITKPPILLADEPTSNLDEMLAYKMISILEEFNKLGITIIIATHDLKLIAKFKKRTLIINKGQIVSDVPDTEASKISPIYYKTIQPL